MSPLAGQARGGTLDEMSRDLSADASAKGICLLVADDDHKVRTLCAALLTEAKGIETVVTAADGVEAVELARQRRLELAVLDLNMPRLDGIGAALALRALQPWMRIALHSSDPESLGGRAAGLGLQLFDKVDFDRLVEWVERQATGDASVCVRQSRASSTSPAM
jgi:DNA-binding NarL/FixJ family response regulator